MATPGEHKTVQSRILAYAQEIGWTYVPRAEAETRRGKTEDSNNASPSIFFDDLLDAKTLERWYGARTDRTSPGGDFGYSTFAALTHGYNKQYFLTGRVGYGREAYQLLSGNRIVNKFNSHNFGLNWRHWLGDDWGYNLGSEYYKNPTYHRLGGTASVFKEF